MEPQRCQPHRLTVLFSGLPASGLPSQFHHPCTEWPEPTRHGASAPCLGAASSSQQVLQGDYWVQIPGAVHRQTSIQIRYRSNFAAPVSQMCSVMQQENRAGATMTPALNRRPWSTGRRFPPIRRWAGGLIRMIPAFGLRSVVPEFPAGPLRSCRVRSWAGPCAFPLQFRVHGAAGPAAGEPHGAIHLGVAHWPLASASRAGSPYPRHLARVLDFPVGPPDRGMYKYYGPGHHMAFWHQLGTKPIGKRVLLLPEPRPGPPAEPKIICHPEAGNTKYIPLSAWAPTHARNAGAPRWLNMG